MPSKQNIGVRFSLSAKKIKINFLNYISILMVYIFGTKMPKKLKIQNALTKIFGLGYNQSKFIVNNLGITSKGFIYDLTKHQKFKLLHLLETSNILLKLDLKRQRMNCLNKLIKIKSYKGARLLLGLPLRGQRTHTNRKTSKKILNNFRDNRTR